MASRAERLTRRQQRLAEKGLEKQLSKFPTIGQLNFELRKVNPITENQLRTFEHYYDDQNIFLEGCAGTGKTYISMYLALQSIEDKRSPYRKLVIVRTAQPTKQIGHLPGDEKQKGSVYELPYKSICSDLYHRDDAYEVLKNKGVIDFALTSFMRGTTIDNAIVIVDEVQNMVETEWFTVLSRIGQNTRLIICGDSRQDDITSERFHEKSGMQILKRVLTHMEQSIKVVTFQTDDIVRSGFVKDLITTMYKLGI